MNTKYKALLLAICAVVVATAVTFGTLAYLTDADVEVNTFTVGAVGLKLDEKDVDNSTPLKDRDTANEYHLLPGHTYEKDPTVTVDKGSMNAYVRMLVQVENIAQLKEAIPGDDYIANGVFLLEKLCSGWDKNVWQMHGYTENGTTGIYEFRYHKVVTQEECAATDLALEPLFTHITVPGEVDNDGVEKLAAVKIHVAAHATQADGFDTAAAAWAAFDTQMAG